MKIKNENIRIEALNSAIEMNHGKSSYETIEISAESYQKSVTDMIEITKVGRELCAAIHLFEDVEYKRIRFRPSILRCLKAGDVFLVTMGFLENDWHVLYSSPRYETEEFVDDLGLSL